MIELRTYQDAVEHVLDRCDDTRTARNLRMARRAVLNAYRRFPTLHDWNYFKRRYILSTEASYSTGTVVYDHTGGAHERMLTLTGGTWPTNASYGVVIIDGVHYPIDERKSSTIVTLYTDQNPGADVASTTYEYYREAYPFPDMGDRIGVLMEVDGTTESELEYVAPEQLHSIARGYDQTTDRPQYYSLRNDGRLYGVMQLLLAPPPNSVKSYEYIYKARPRELSVEKEFAGTVTVTGSATTVTGTSTAFTSSHVGSLIRFSGNSTNVPTSKEGSMIEALDNPFVAQRRITAVASATSLTIDSAASTSTLTGVKYMISDPIDVHPSYIDALFALADAEFGMMTNREDAGKRRMRSDELLLFAMDADRRSLAVQGVNDYTDDGNVWGDVTVT